MSFEARRSRKKSEVEAKLVIEEQEKRKQEILLEEARKHPEFAEMMNIATNEELRAALQHLNEKFGQPNNPFLVELTHTLERTPMSLGLSGSDLQGIGDLFLTLPLGPSPRDKNKKMSVILRIYHRETRRFSREYQVVIDIPELCEVPRRSPHSGVSYETSEKWKPPVQNGLFLDLDAILDFFAEQLEDPNPNYLEVTGLSWISESD